MARIRTIKPEFFRHEALQDLEAENPGSYVMLVFAALWGHCDKAGRFEWKPRSLKLDILPFLPFDMAATLALLARAGLLERYTVDGKDYGVIPSFTTHQRIGGKEAQEKPKYPGMDGEASPVDGEKSGSNGEAPGKRPGLQEGKGREEEREEEGKEQFPPMPPASGGGSPGKGRSPKITFRAFADECRAAGEKLIPPTDPVFVHATDMGIPVEFVQLAWRAFAHKYRDTDRRQKDWRAHFRSAVRGNWGNVWFCRPDGTCELTTVGVQLKRERDAEAERKAQQEMEDQAA
ncbi:hypothetical protein ACHZ97_14420 [Lysobacter soli]|uniref:hypothetical protein n=1 Tax=Lysobacter soli TaxID=453783 RepID=UPI0037C82D93